MTTAHRPTWYNAIGGENQGGNRKVSQTAKVCSRDLPGHTKMKTRDLSDYVEDKEVFRNNLIQLEGGATDKDNSHRLLAIENIKRLTNHDYTNPFPEDEDDEVEEEWKSRRRKGGKKAKRKGPATGRSTNRAKGEGSQEGGQSEDRSDDRSAAPSAGSSDGSSHGSPEDRSDDHSDGSSDDQSEDEEEKELLRELENLKREKMEKQRQEKQEQELLQSRKNNVLTNNPLINLEDNSDNEEGEGMSRKRKWTEEAIFRNTCEKKEKKSTFINDTVRTAFHKKFLFKYIH
ncbi:cell cycle control protein cwf15 [Plasmodium cynomolgi strain B]|uniref:Cell cycle control protein cwf15 n=1 Tax=Plasmodium cynomolgi (strain B) TaxID=1120755 RepID=K6V6V9_PLACD|nr:cell cycle control protein cwf15 [Plasmodium cynomolgi strain B]GAB64852.1 cell cycle control protein cwf15 [Plasmodium cynomolgi strain B]